MRIDRVVWDFNGTILDDVEIGLGATNILLDRRGLPRVAVEDYYNLFSFPVRDYYERIGFDFSSETYEAVADEWVVEYRRLEPTATLRPGVRGLISALAARGIPQTVLSATEQGMLTDQLSALGILSCFDRVLGRSDVHATDKTALAAAYAAERHGECILMIGDTDHDAACAKVAGFSCALVAGGHHSRARLLATGFPVYDGIPALHACLKEEGVI